MRAAMGCPMPDPSADGSAVLSIHLGGLAARAWKGFVLREGGDPDREVIEKLSRSLGLVL